MTTQIPQTDPDSLRIQAHRLSRLLHDLQGVLRSQREILRQRGMSLPSGVLTLLEDAQIAVQSLAVNLKEEEESLKQFRALTDTAAMINSTLDLDEVLNQAMDTVIQLTGAERGYLMLRNEHTGELEFRVARNIDPDGLSQDTFVVSRSVIKRVADTGEPVVTTNAQSDPRFAAQDSIVSFALRSILCVPLKIKDGLIGVIYADNRIRAGLFGESELAMLNAFASQAAIAIENARMFERISAALREINDIKELMDDVFASIPSGVVVADGANHIRTCNPAGRDILDLRDITVLPAGAADSQLAMLGEGFLRLMASVRTEKRRSEVELVTDISTRGQRHLMLKLNPLLSAAETTDDVAIVLDDLTEERQREAQLSVVRRYLPPAMVDNIESIAQLGLGGVRRTITVAFVDACQISAFPASFTPQQQMEALNRCMTVASEAIHRHGGIVDKYMGTEIMALFNTQLNPSDDHEWQAVSAAMDIVTAYLELDLGPEVPVGGISYRVGIHSGIATMGNVGSLNRREFTAIGDTVNLAHRLVEIAEQGEILLTGEVFARSNDSATRPGQAFTFADRGEQTIRGRRKPVKLYQLKHQRMAT